MSNFGITPKLPLALDQVDHKFVLLKTYPQTIKQNFKNLILTNPGERMMDINFGVGLYQYLFELRGDAETLIRGKVYEQVEKYMPFIEVVDIIFPASLDGVESPEILQMKVIYRILPLNQVDTLEITTNQTSQYW